MHRGRRVRRPGVAQDGSVTELANAWQDYVCRTEAREHVQMRARTVQLQNRQVGKKPCCARESAALLWSKRAYALIGSTSREVSVGTRRWRLCVVVIAIDIKRGEADAPRTQPMKMTTLTMSHTPAKAVCRLKAIRHIEKID